jgi:hypothetical protein
MSPLTSTQRNLPQIVQESSKNLKKEEINSVSVAIKHQ